MTRIALYAAVLALAGCDQLDQMMGKDQAPTTDGAGAGGSSGGGGTSGGGGDAGPIKIGGSPAKEGGSGLINTIAGDPGPAPGIVASQCNELTDGGPLAGPDCVTAEIACGQTIVGHTRGAGVNQYDTEFYEAKRCWPGTRNHDSGDERVYRFVFDEDPVTKGKKSTRAIINFDTPCADLDLTYMNVVGKRSQCPTVNDRVQTCDMINFKNSPRRESRLDMFAGEVWYFLVEGANDAEGGFSLTLECETTRNPNL